MESEPDTDAGSSARQTEPMIKVQNARDTNDDVAACEASVSGATSHVTDRARANAGVAMVIIFIGMVIQGVAKAPRAPFSTAFIDDNVEKTKTGFYVVRGALDQFMKLAVQLAFKCDQPDLYNSPGYQNKISRIKTFAKRAAND
nr:hypothetical protein BaRGS_003723 [Batillaria attramentaria]